MHVLFFHKNFPGQFGHIARRLVRKEGFRCTFVCEQPAGGPVARVTDFPAGTQWISAAPPAAASFQVSMSPTPAVPAPPAEEWVEGIRVIRYPAESTEDATYDGQIARGYRIFQHLRGREPVRPDVAVGTGIYGSTQFLGELYRCPVVHCFDYYFRPEESFLTFRPEFPPDEFDLFRARAYNGLVLLDLHACAAGYSPTEWQRNLFPAEYRSKIATIFDGVDREFWSRRRPERRIAGRPIPAGVRIVTYVARGLEALRGFDIFMRAARRIAEQRRDVLFVVVGSEDFYHGPDRRYIRARSFLEHVLQQGPYDLSRFLFTGRIPSAQLVDVLGLSDLHVYLTAPFVLSWSLFDALACGCTVLASDTGPVREVVRDGETGLLVDFFDVEGLAQKALRVLDRPEDFRHLGQAGVRLVDEKYSLDRVVPQMVELYRRAVGAR